MMGMEDLGGWKMRDRILFLSMITLMIWGLVLLGEGGMVQGAGVPDPDDSSCQACHPAEAEEWRKSAHARALADLKDKGKDQCLDCHTAENFLGWQAGGAKRVSVETARFSVNCVVCHTTHEERNDPKNILRLPPDKLCAACHSMGKIAASQTPQHNQQEMLMGMGALGPGAGNLPGPMAELGITCVHCHMPVKVSEGKEESTKPARSHVFRLIKPGEEGTDGCTYCHNNFRPSLLRRDIDRKQGEVEERLKQAAELLEAKKDFSSHPQYLQAKFNYEFIKNDRSKGYHNPLYASVLLDRIIKTLQELK